MTEITVVGLGPGPKEHLTLGALAAMQKAHRLVLATARHGVAEHLKAEGIAFDTLDSLFDESEDFDQFAAAAAERLIALSAEGPLVYGVADPLSDSSVAALRDRLPEGLKLLPGLPALSAFLAQAPAPLPILYTDATRLQVFDGQRPLCISELNSRQLAGDCKLQLLDYYDPDSPLYFFPPGKAAERRVVRTTLEELDRQPRYDHSAGAVLLPKAGWERERYDMQDLVRLMRKLRAPGGCPWDREQTHRSLARYLSEEAHEAVHAISEEDWLALADELGDVLLQVVFHADIGEETGTLSLADITGSVCRKMIRRHRHVFGGSRLDTPEQVEESWERIKQEERGQQSAADKMRAIPASLPAMLRSIKVQEAAAKLGFDWPEALQALDKVHEEAEELRSDVQAGKDPRDELGDLFFACLNTARLMGQNPDELVNMATDKFIKRFETMEKAIKTDQKDSKCLTLDDWDVYWSRSKQAE